MKSKKRVLLTVNPGLIEGKRFQTVRSMVTALHSICDLFIVPITGYDFKRKRLDSFKRVSKGRFERSGWIKPQADLWIVYTDGYWLDAKTLGFKHRREFIRAQLSLHEENLQNGNVEKLINTPQAERHCLKSWLAELNPAQWGVIPTYRFADWKEAHDFLRQEKTIVAKPNWGGANAGILKIAGDSQFQAFQEMLKECESTIKDDYSFQPLAKGPEKRLWYVNGKCVAGRKIYGRHTPWSENTSEFRIVEYWNSNSKEFQKDLATADKICRKSGITLGSIDFIGTQINEINGAGTTFIQYDEMTKIVDARLPLIDYLQSAVKE